jgi:NAD(P)H-hydrate epimerase
MLEFGMVKEITQEYVKGLLPLPRRDAHKGTAGRVLIIAGSPGMAGAAVLASGAALRSGAGLVYVSAAERLWPIIQTHEPCAVCVGRHIEDGAALGRYDAIAIGPGLGTSDEAAALVGFVIENYEGALVIDADALNIIADGGATLSRETPKRNNTIITPHLGEAARLLGVGAGEIPSDREAAAVALAEKYGAVAVLKGHRTLVASSENADIGMDKDMDMSASGSAEKNRAISENTTGNPGMATAGSGDVLTGVIASFAARGMSAFEAATAGVYIHGLAGDIASEHQGEYGLIATDIVHALPAAIKQAAQ